ncbi:hypothetical protein STEG23_028092, partial [Scotinomys teguina]
IQYHSAKTRRRRKDLDRRVPNLLVIFCCELISGEKYNNSTSPSGLAFVEVDAELTGVPLFLNGF